MPKQTTGKHVAEPTFEEYCAEEDERIRLYQMTGAYTPGRSWESGKHS